MMNYSIAGTVSLTRPLLVMMMMTMMMDQS